MWDIKYRPLVFEDVLGQEGAVQLLKARLANGTALDTNYVFSGGHGQGKCVVGDTLVPTDIGLVRIRDLMGSHQIDPSGRTVQQESGTAVAAYSYRGGLRDTLRITTHRGFSIEGTPNHRILVMTLQGALDWRSLGDLRSGDYACIIPRGIFGEDVALSDFTYSKSEGDHSSIPFSPPARMTPALGRLLGYMVGDGCGPSRRVNISCAEPDVIQDQTDLLTSILGPSSITPDKRRDSLVTVRCLRVQARDFLAYAGAGYDQAGLKEVPWAVLQSSKKVAQEFLRGYMEADGGVVEKSLTLEFTSKSEALARQVRLLLLQFGVVGRLYTKEHPKYGTYWRWQAFGEDITTFQREIGFVSKRKTAALRRVTLKSKGLTRSIPNQKAALREFYRQLPQRSCVTHAAFKARTNGYALGCTERVLRLAVATHPYNPITPQFDRILKADFVYDRVTTITPGKAEVYDLNVPEGESFAANGFVNHNTTLARILAKAMLCQRLTKDHPEPCNECDNCTDILSDTSSAYVEQDAASRGTIEHVRAIVEDLPFTVFNAPKRVYVFDEAHRMSKDAQDVLLKPLEDKKMVGIFCTTEPEKIRGPIRSRCEEYAIRKITREDVLVRMKKILDKEGVIHEDDGVLTVIDFSGGHVRDVLNRLEMIAQAGEVSVATVREYLHLNVVSTYYEILLALGDTKRAIELVELATDRVSAEEVAAGLAEAAMNSFRLANGMFAEFVYVDRKLGQQLWERFGIGCVKIAEFFLRARYATKVSLICDVLSLTNGVPAQNASPLVIQVGGPQVSVTTPPQAQPPAAPAHPTAQSAGPLVSASPVVGAPAAPPQPTAPPTPPKPLGNGMRADGVGPIGSGDPLALTEFDHKVVSTEKPRSRKIDTHLPYMIQQPRVEDAMQILQPDEWRREFERKWLSLRG